MPIDTDVETRMLCFGKMGEQHINDCIMGCCFIEHDLCYMQTKKNLNTFKRKLEDKVII